MNFDYINKNQWWDLDATVRSLYKFNSILLFDSVKFQVNGYYLKFGP